MSTHGRIWKAGLLLILLVACPKPNATLEYRISSVQPAPVTPGDEVTVFGVLPASARISLGGVMLSAIPVTDGYRVTVPSDSEAGDQTLEVRGGGSTLTSSLSIDPRLDRAVATGNELRLEGAGWRAATALSVMVNGLARPVQRDGTALIVGNLASGAFGSFTVAVRVGERNSNALSVSREAGSIAGKVLLPASAPLTSARIAPLALESTAVQPSASLLTESDPGLVTGALEVRELTALGVWRMRFASSGEARVALETLKARGVKARFEINLRVSADVRALDAAPPAQPGAGQWFLAKAGLPLTSSSATGAGVTVAVVDMGVRLDHPDLSANLLPGYDFVDNDSDPSPASSAEGHGTHVAGLVAANGLARGVAPGAKIVPIRALNAQGGSESAVALAILWAADLIPTQSNPHKAQIINLSLGAGAYSGPIADAVLRAQSAGAIIVAAAGNDGSATVSYPAALPGVIAVTALAGTVTPYQPFYASHGPGTWITAYGGDTVADQDGNGVPDGILSTDNTPSGYGLRMGTSMACPQVAGMVALSLSSGTRPGLARGTLARTAGDLGAWGFDTRYGWGLISSRAVTSSIPRTYVLALQGATVKAWTLVQPDGSYRLDNLEPDQSYTILAASDANNNATLAENAETLSTAVTVTARSRHAQTMPDLELQPSSGTVTYTLEARP